MSRIIAGELGGRRIAVPDGRATRPTSDRTREALFSSIEATHDLDGGLFLDLYAGSGAVALEALSRGAPSAVLVESARPALQAIERNVRDLRVADRVTVLAGRVESLTARLAGVRALTVFVDPPYDDDADALAALLGDLLAAEAIDCEALVVVERDRRAGWRWPPQIEPVRDRRYGETVLWYGRPL
ncbi:16S rRNA (guanine(966)-N(2))-methyltransferase RsmD [Blastococcus sp. Marseille-P5729]|uniref:16S rRNA (guanine(966)-N(2))-methyltransferase RsmD n=1 Tax=Blastococcus sp. Marseille-P5729 TaxID=2086582 RepID=UPI000D0E7913|nr:16S rRNA (guanine(966)-N(2))-methyltransferase RsmD [Blastococcus sp. Marseille-P5729]